MHCGDALEREVVVHHGEHTFLHFAAIPCVEDDLLAGSNVEGDAGFAAETELGEVLNFGLGCAENYEVGLLVEFLLVLRTDEHIGNEVGLPCNLHDEANLHTGVGVGAAEAVDYEEPLAAELLLGELLDALPCLFAHLVVVVGVTFGGPPDFAGSAFLCGFVVYDVFVFRRTAGIYTGHYVDGTEFGNLTFVEAFEAGFGLFVVKDFIGRVVKDFLHTFDTVLAQIEIRHSLYF